MRTMDFNVQGTIFNKSNQFLCFSDDVDIIRRTSATRAEAYIRLKHEAELIGFRIDVSKTKYMLAVGTERNQIPLGSNFVIDGDEHEVFDKSSTRP